jgi:hypothetical protein
VTRRRRKNLLDDLGDRRGYSHLKEEALDRTKWRNLLEETGDLSSDRLLMMMNSKEKVQIYGQIKKTHNKQYASNKHKKKA